MERRIEKTIVGAGLALTGVLALVGLDRALSRGDRVRHARERARLLHLRDAIVVFALEARRFPETLDELVPWCASEEMIAARHDRASGKAEAFAWDASTGRLAWPGPFTVRGVVGREWPLVIMIEPPDVPGFANVRAPPRGRMREGASDARRRRRPPRRRADAPSREADDAFGADAPQEAGGPGEPGEARAPRPVELGPDSVVIEAEDFQFLTYGWEIGEDAAASGGRYAHTKEGVGDFESEAKIAADPSVRSGDFYNVTGDRRPVEARFRFVAPSSGVYFVAARTMAERSQCSNITYVCLNGQKHSAGYNGSQPFRWIWHPVAHARLAEGANTLSLMAHQDGVRVDQIVITPRWSTLARGGGRTFSGGARSAAAPGGDVGPGVLSLSADSLVMTENSAPVVRAYVHRNDPALAGAAVRFAIELPDGRTLGEEHEEHEVAFDAGDLACAPCGLALPEPLERREYLLRARLVASGEEVETRTLVLERHFDWLVMGPLPFMGVRDRAEPEADARPRASYGFGGREFSWERYTGVEGPRDAGGVRAAALDRKRLGRFGLLDFGLHYSGRSFDCVPNVSLYAYTEVRAARAGEYLLKAQGDDDLVVWVNGRETVTIDEEGPPIRTARQVRVRLEEGRNRVLFRLNQRAGQWQASVRFRTVDEQVAPVVGVPFDEQDVER